MAISRTLSHLSGRNWLHLSGLDDITVADNASLDITGDFTLSFMIKLDPDPLIPVTYILCTKGHPTDPSLGSLAIDVVDGFVYFYLHDANGINSLVYKTNSAIMNTSEVVMLTFSWDSVNNIVKIYKDAVETAITIQTSDPDYHATPAAMGNIRTNNDPFVFGQGFGKTGFKGRIVDAIYSTAVWDSSKVYDHFVSLEYTGQYPEYGTIVFNSDRNGFYNLHTMNALGENQTILRTAAFNEYRPAWTPDGNYVVFTSGIGSPAGSLYRIDSNGGNPFQVANLLSSFQVDAGSSIDVTVDGQKAIVGNVYSAQDRFLVDIFTGTITSGATSFGFGTTTGGPYNPNACHPTNPRKFLVGGWYTTNSIRLYEVTSTADNSFSGSTQVLLYSLTTSDKQALPSAFYNAQGTKIVYTVRLTGSSPYQIYIMDSNGGNLQQLTADSWSSIGACFNPGYKSEFTVSGGNALVNATLYNFLQDTWAVRYDVTGGVAPSGLTNGATYYIKKQPGSLLTLYPSLTDAQGDTSAIAIGTLGAGMHTLINIDGQKILYTQNSNGKWQLHTMNIDGSNKVNISNNPYNDVDADWKV